uniref:FAM21/CAPZIP domain-containing protein n=1 Tax=Sphenodon punctatus TaxID=8508 RepID=A0A8D0LCN1_SPHPU
MSDLFAVAPKGEETIEKEVRVPINDEPSSKAVRKVPAGAVSLFPGANEVFSPSLLVEKETKKPVEKSMEKVPKQPGKVSLFDDDDDDNFFVVSNNKRSNPAIVKSAAELFDCDDEGDLFKEKHEVSPAAVSNASKEAKRHNETLVGKKSQPSSAEDLKPATPTLPKSLKGLFSDEEDSEDLFAAPAEKQQSKPPQEKAKQLDTLKKASSSLFSSDEEEHWHTAKQNKPISKDGQKGEAVKPASVISQPATRPSLFEDGQEEDLFAITTDSQRKHPKAALLFEEDAINGGSLFGPQPSFLPSVTQAAVEKSQAPPSLFAEEENLLETPTRRQMEDKAGHTEQLGAVPASVSEGGDSTEQQEKAKLEPFTVPALGPTSNSNMFATSPPLLDKEARSRGKNVLSLFEEEEEEKMEDQSVIKNVQKEMGKTIEKSASSKSTGVFQDEELLFSHKLQKDNDSDVDLFASTKKPGPAKHDVKLPSGEGLFGDDDDDYDLFSTAKAKHPKVAEKKIVVKKDSAVPFLESNKVRESNQRVKQDGVKLEATEKSTGPAPIKSKEPSSRIGKLQANLAINPAALLPSAIPKLSSVKSVLPGLETQPDEPDGTRCTDATSAAGNNQESGVSFDCPMQADTLQSANKSRIKVTGKRRPPTRTARRLATQESSENEEMTITEEPPRLSSKQSFVLPNAQQPCEREPECVENAKLPLRSDSGTPSPKAGRCPPAKPMDLKVGNDLFGSDDLFVNSLVSKPAPAAKAKEGGLETLAGKAPKSGEKKPALTVLDESGGEDIFSAIKQKPSKKASPISFLENEEDLFTSKKPTKKKELKPALQPDPDQKAQDIFEDDIFATEAIKTPTKAKEKVPETNLFDDNVDIFADLMVKPKEKAKKKVEPKSIFDDDMDDIFSSSSQPKTSALKCRSPQTASEATKSEIKASSTFDDPLNAFGGQ